MDQERIERAVKELLAGIGEEQLNEEVIANSPRRIAAMYAEFFRGIDRDPADVLEVLYQEKYEEMIVMRDISFRSSPSVSTTFSRSWARRTSSTFPRPVESWEPANWPEPSTSQPDVRNCRKG